MTAQDGIEKSVMLKASVDQCFNQDFDDDIRGILNSQRQ